VKTRSIWFLLFSFPALGGISPSVVKESALTHHPTVLAAFEKMKAEEEAVTGARGAFDTKIVSDYRRQMKDDYRTTLSRSFLVKPLPLANSKIYAGSEQISNPNGKMSPVYNTGNPATTGQPGNYSVLGVQLSLWKNLLIDPSRAAVKSAKFGAQIAKGEKSLIQWDIARLGQLAYWEWVTALKVKKAYEELLKNSETRSDYLAARSKKGDIAQIVVTENEQYIASRKGLLQSAQERLIRAEFALSLFYRDEQGEPIPVVSEQVYEDYPSPLGALLEKLDISPNINEIMKKRPELKNLAFQVERTGLEVELAEQELKPQLDVTTEYYQRTNDNPSIPRDYLMVMAQVSVPIERNLGLGNRGAAKARRMIAQRELSLGQETYKFEVMALRRALTLRLEQVTQAGIELSKAKELVESETYKFKTGGGNLFLVNLREQAQTSAEASFHEARLAFMDSYLRYEMLVHTEE
jgi:outer membrane protein TolC